MEYKINDTSYEGISPGTIGVAQKISSDYEFSEIPRSGLCFLERNYVQPCSQNQY